MAIRDQSPASLSLSVVVLAVMLLPLSLSAEVQTPQQAAAPEQKASAEQPVVQQVPETIEETRPQLKQEPPPLNPYASNPVATKAVDRNISLFSERIKERFSMWLGRSGKYLDMMKGILKANDVPEDIAFLPLIESGFNPNAYSVARAVGPWQFISATGKRYGLKIDWWRDERKDPAKSTLAAANYLKDLYSMFGSWNLAMAAYNAGEGRILKALNRSKSDDYWSLLGTKHIKPETKEYVPRFIAAKMIALDPVSYGFEDLEYHAPLQYDEVALERPVDLDVAASCSQSSEKAIRELNPELRRWSTPPNVQSYTLRIPMGSRELFLECLSKIPDNERFTIVEYTVKKGDTIHAIAKKLGVPVNVILELNDGIHPFAVGQKISLPPMDKFSPDRDDRMSVKKAKYRTGKKKGLTGEGKKAVVKQATAHDHAAAAKKVSHRSSKKIKMGQKKVLVTALNKKDSPAVND